MRLNPRINDLLDNLPVLDFVAIHTLYNRNVLCRLSPYLICNVRYQRVFIAGHGAFIAGSAACCRIATVLFTSYIGHLLFLSLINIMTIFSPMALLFLPAVVLALGPIVVQDGTLLQHNDVKVPVTLGVMSQCPDAMLCEAVFDQVLKKVIGIVDIQLTYVAQ